MANQVYLRKYGEAATIDFELFEVDGVNFRVDAVHASGDTTLMRDEAIEVNTTNGFIDEGKGYSIVLTATEMQAARIKIDVVDQTATKVWLDRSLIIETYGHASAQHAFDLDSANVSLPSIPANWITAAGIASNALTAAKINTGALNGKGDWSLASVLGALTDVAAAGDPTTTETLMQYIKQLINTLEGTAGIGTFPAEAAPGNAVSLAEVVRAIHSEAIATRSEVGSNSTQLATIINRIGDFAGTGLNTIKGFIQAIFRSDAGVTGANTPSEINEIENTVAGTFDGTTESLQATGDKVTLVQAKTDNLPTRLQKNVAYNNFAFVMVDASDNPLTGLTVTVTRSIDNGAFASTTNSPTEIANGGYGIDWSAADLNGDSILFRFTATGAKDLFITVVTNL